MGYFLTRWGIRTFLSALLYTVTYTHNCYWQFLNTLTLAMETRYISAMFVIDTADCLTVQNLLAVTAANPMHVYILQLQLDC